MTAQAKALVFDTGPLRHFAINGWLEVLHFIASDRAVLIPESVEQELKRQVHELPELGQVLNASWITVDRSDDIDFLSAFARYADRLVVDTRNRGECGVLALGEVRGFEVVLDDAVARTIAQENDIQLTATLPLLCTAIRVGKLTVPLVSQIADDLFIGEYFLPFGPGGFRQWALEQDLIDYEAP